MFVFRLNVDMENVLVPHQGMGSVKFVMLECIIEGTGMSLLINKEYLPERRIGNGTRQNRS